MDAGLYVVIALFELVLVTLGGLRELLGQGTLFSQAHLMFGDAARDFVILLGQDFKGALLAILPPGAFLGLGLLIALKNVIDKRAKLRKAIRMEEDTSAEAAASG